MHIGLIGGIGPAATISYYQRLSNRMRELQVPLELTIVNADVQELTRNNLADRRDAQAAAYAVLLARLHAAGAQCAAITSLGGHFCFDETVSLSPLPLVSGVAPLDAHFAAAGIRRVGLLGTAVVMRTRLYGKLTHTEAVACDDDLDRISQAYMTMAMRGACTDDERAMMIAAGRRMVTEQGADAVVLAGTDLNLAFDGRDDPGYPVIDALDVHVALLAELAAGRRGLEGVATTR